MIEVEWTHRARGRLRDLYASIAEDQPMNAERFIEQLIERGDSLAEQLLQCLMRRRVQRPI